MGSSNKLQWSAKIRKNKHPPIYSEPESRLIQIAKDSVVQWLSDLPLKQLFAGIGGSSLSVKGFSPFILLSFLICFLFPLYNFTGSYQQGNIRYISSYFGFLKFYFL